MISVQRDAGVWTITLERPEKANALTGSMLREIRDVAVSAKGRARVLVITATGRVFSAGADLEEAEAGLATDPVWEGVSAAIKDHDGLTIAALNGTLAGGAFGMVLACDLRVAVSDAKFFYPVMRLGFLPQPSDPDRLAALVGPARAKLLLMAGAKIDATEALAIGLIDRVVAREDLLPVVSELAADTAAAPQEIASGIKALCR